MKETSYKQFGFEPIIEDNHVLYYQKDNFRIDDKYKMSDTGSIELYIQVLDKNKLLFEGKTEKEINTFLTEQNV